MFLQRNGFSVTFPGAFLLGLVLRLGGDANLGLPMIRNPVLVQYLVPGVTTILLGWTLQDRWSGCGVASVRPAGQLTGARLLATVGVCLVAAGTALIGQSGQDLFWASLWLLAVAVAVGVCGSAWWMPVLALEFVLLRLASSDPETLSLLVDPGWAVGALAASGGGAVIAAGTCGRLHDLAGRCTAFS